MLWRKPVRFACAVACASFASSVSAGFVATSDPGGFTTVQSKLGTEYSGLAGFGAWSFDVREGVAIAHSATASFIDFASVLPEKSASLGGGADTWRLGVTAMEMSGLELPETYTEFRIAVILDGVSAGVLSIPVSSTAEQTAFIDLGTLVGDVDVRLRWLNPGTRFFDNQPLLGIGVVQFAASEIPTPGASPLAGLGMPALTRRGRSVA